MDRLSTTESLCLRFDSGDVVVKIGKDEKDWPLLHSAYLERDHACHGTSFQR